MQFNRMSEQVQSSSQSQGVVYDQGLRSYLLGVYNYMASAILLTGIVAYMAGTSEAFLELMFSMKADGSVGLSPAAYIVMFAPLGVVFYLSARLHALSENAAKMWFFGYAALMGLSLYYVFALFTGVSVARVFFITAGTFGAMSLYGYTTKKDLSSMGSFLMMGLIGLIIASVVNIFLQSSALHFAVSIIGVLLFVGLTAYDTQKIKNSYYAVAGHAEMMGKAAIMGALSLYLDFINLFVMLLQFFGDRR